MSFRSYKIRKMSSAQHRLPFFTTERVDERFGNPKSKSERGGLFFETMNGRDHLQISIHVKIWVVTDRVEQRLQNTGNELIIALTSVLEEMGLDHNLFVSLLESCAFGSSSLGKQWTYSY